MRRALSSFVLLLILSALLASCAKKTDQLTETASDSLLASNPTEQTSGNITPSTEYQTPPAEQPPAPAPIRRASTRPRPATTPASEPRNAGVTIPAGTPLAIEVAAQISSETAQPGDTWTGTIKEPVVVGGNAPIPTGATVNGVIVGSQGAQRGGRAFLVLAVKSVTVNGETHSLSAGTDSIIAGSTRARNLGAIAGSAAAGALIGKAVGGSGKGALIGGILGGAAATGAVARSKGYQVVIKEGTVITFHTNNSVVMR